MPGVSSIRRSQAVIGNRIAFAHAYRDQPLREDALRPQVAANRTGTTLGQGLVVLVRTAVVGVTGACFTIGALGYLVVFFWKRRGAES